MPLYAQVIRRQDRDFHKEKLTNPPLHSSSSSSSISNRIADINSLRCCVGIIGEIMRLGVLKWEKQRKIGWVYSKLDGYITPCQANPRKSFHYSAVIVAVTVILTSRRCRGHGRDAVVTVLASDCSLQMMPDAVATEGPRRCRSLTRCRVRYTRRETLIPM